VSGDARSLTEIIAAIDHAVKYGGQLGLEWQRYDQDFSPVADYLVKLRAEGKIEIVTVEEMIAHHGIKSGSPTAPPPAGPPSPAPPPAGPPPAALLPFDQVERSFTQTAALFSGLWAQARTRTVRIERGSARLRKSNMPAIPAHCERSLLRIRQCWSSIRDD
jgi:hypothetical protein